MTFSNSSSPRWPCSSHRERSLADVQAWGQIEISGTEDDWIGEETSLSVSQVRYISARTSQPPTRGWKGTTMSSRNHLDTSKGARSMETKFSQISRDATRQGIKSNQCSNQSMMDLTRSDVLGHACPFLHVEMKGNAAQRGRRTAAS